jgi:hypothetical protein
MEVKIKYELEEECWSCNGTGDRNKQYDPTPGDACSYCKGAGVQLTDEGQKLVAFIQKYFGIKAQKPCWTTMAKKNQILYMRNQSEGTIFRRFKELENAVMLENMTLLVNAGLQISNLEFETPDDVTCVRFTVVDYFGPGGHDNCLGNRYRVNFTCRLVEEVGDGVLSITDNARWIQKRIFRDGQLAANQPAFNAEVGDAIRQWSKRMHGVK